MKIAFLVHAAASCWNNGNAHFLRGVVTALQALGHEAIVLEPAGAWSRANLLADAGEAAFDAFEDAFPTLRPELYDGTIDALERVAAHAPDLVVVHEWNEPALVNALGDWRKRRAPFVLLFHDTHHRAVSAPQELSRCDLSGYDGVLAFGTVIADIYASRGWGSRAWTWHEAADTRLFRPLAAEKTGDLVWIGNWGDEERSEELAEFLLAPSARLGLATTIHGVRYPRAALEKLAAHGVRYGGWLANHRAPEMFARHRVTVHVPRRQYASVLHGIPTIRVFEALACGIPLVSAPWRDSEGLFPAGAYLTARNGAEMERHLAAVLADPDLAASLVETGLAAIAGRHTCDHRAEELLAIYTSIAIPRATPQGLAMNFAFFGSSLVSAYWNGAATYYRGLIKALAARGHSIVFYEPDAFGRQQHRDIPDPDWARVIVYEANEAVMAQHLEEACGWADVLVKCSGVGVLDRALEAGVAAAGAPHRATLFWDVDAPATLESIDADRDDPMRTHVPRFDAIFTYGGGAAVVDAYRALGAKRCVPIYNAVDPDTHHPVPPQPAFASDLAFLGNRLPDREARVEDFFLAAAERLPQATFLLGGSGWDDKPMPANVRYVGHMFTRDHNALNVSAKAVLNINRNSMARFGASPPTRIFEAAGAGAAIISDRWAGIDQFLEPGSEILVASDGAEVAEHVAALTPAAARRIGDAARRRVLAEHTYRHRAAEVEAVLDGRDRWREAV